MTGERSDEAIQSGLRALWIGDHMDCKCRRGGRLWGGELSSEG